METQLGTTAEPTQISHGRGERGASLVEYALLVALIAVVCVVSVAYFGSQTGDSLSRVGSSVEGT